MRLIWGSASHVGMLRQQNEDSYVAEGDVFAVADGMGGHNAGEVASALAITQLRAAVRSGLSSAGDVSRAINEANAAIHSASGGASDQRGMGTTLTAIVPLAADGSEPQRVVVANVGDSRAYLLRSGTLKQLSVDHSYVQELLNEGLISPDEAREHPRRNIVTRALGIDGEVNADTWVLPMLEGDRYLLCSDGLIDEVEDERITEIVATTSDAQAAAEQLVNAANEHGGRDNITVVIVDVVADVPDRTATTPSRPNDTTTPTRRLRALPVAIAAALVAVVIGTVVATGIFARQGYFVGFDGSTERSRLVVYKGRPQTLLWFRPTVHKDSGVTRSEVFTALADDIDQRPRFDSLADAVRYVDAIRDEVDSPNTSGVGS